MFYYILFIIAVALVFDFLNGFHDAANSIATIVSTRVLTPLQAVAWAAFFNFVAAFGFGTAVARTVGKGMIDVTKIDETVILGGLMGAILWNIITWYFGLPTSSSHALIGGYAGAAVVRAGWSAVIPSGWYKTLAAIVLSPLIGLSLAFILILVAHLFVRQSGPRKVDQAFRKLQLVSAAFYSLGHGTNDAQKTMGIIAGVLFSTGFLAKFEIPFWVILICHAAIALGTFFGGWRIVKTMGQKIAKLRPIGGFCAETAGAITILSAAYIGIPVSTTHTITGAIVGVGSIHGLSAVKWGVAARIVWAWVLTIPAAALIAACSYLILRLFV
ncbi:MAG TPA: inorganic phosphate transporter [Acidobacteriota bacterium]|jgi:PiT family inorganic phosphate transporter|nr:inorganic phosphate transporter [Acidobacteriota bacterium]